MSSMSLILGLNNNLTPPVTRCQYQFITNLTPEEMPQNLWVKKATLLLLFKYDSHVVYDCTDLLLNKNELGECFKKMWLSTSPGISLVLFDGAKLLPEPMLIYHQ